MGVIKEQIVEPDGTLVETAVVSQYELTDGRGAEIETPTTRT
jgi:hypothetical protein